MVEFLSEISVFYRLEDEGQRSEKRLENMHGRMTWVARGRERRERDRESGE